MSLGVDIEKSFKGFHLQQQFSAGAETLGLLGASGCGKSLTMRSIAGIERPDAGKIVVNGTVFFDRAHGKKAKVDLTPQQRKTALLFQNYMLFPNLTVAQNVAAGIGREVSSADRDAVVQGELKRFGLDGFDNRFPAQLSGGQQQRVALARMLAARPGILMLDEPFSALDAHLKGVLEQNLVSLFDAFDGTILYVSHDIDEALRFCDRIAVIESGHVMEIGTGDEVVNNPHSQAALKLSGCKNATPAEYASDHSVRLPKWGITVETASAVPSDVQCLGVRAFYLEHAAGPGRNCFRVRVDRVSDSRFDRTALLGFMDRDASSVAVVSREESEMTYLHQHLFWRVDKLKVAAEELPHEGEELWIRIPEDKLYLVNR
jgi:molybdate transport system ATP-binding protein